MAAVSFLLGNLEQLAVQFGKRVPRHVGVWMSSCECSDTMFAAAKAEVVWRVQPPQVKGGVEKVTQAKTSQTHVRQNW